MKFKLLLICLLPTLLCGRSFATNTTLTPGMDIAGTIGKAQPGDVITFGAGTFNITSPITIPTGITISGTVPQPGVLQSFINFQLTPTTDDTFYGFQIAGGASNVTITGLDITSSNGAIEMNHGSGYSNIHISGNNIKYGAGQFSDGTLVFGIFGTIPNAGLQITYNYFHDSPGTIRNWSIWYASSANFDYNVFFDVNDGGQLDSPTGVVSVSYNYGTELHRMGQECALDAQCTTFTCTNNTFYNYVQPYYDTEGVSIIGIAQTVNITNNNFYATIGSDAANPTPGYGIADSGGKQRFGYAIECTGNPSNVTGNMLVGPWADDVSSDIANANVSGNTVYGTALWGAFDGEPGPYGYGSIADAANNTVNNNVSAAPTPPTNTNAGPAYYTGQLPSNSSGSSSSGSTGSGSTGSTSGGTTSGGTTTTNTPVTVTTTAQNNPVLPITGVVVTVNSDSTATVTWTSPNPDIISVQINIISTIGRQNFPSSSGTGDITSMAISSMHPGWLIDFTVTAVGSNGQRYSSKPVTASFPGNSVAPWQGLLWGGISVLQTDPYTHS